jgi:Carboxypeptidase regulatory-like domain
MRLLQTGIGFVFFVSLICVFTAASHQRTGSITGEIVDARCGAPIPGWLVTLDGQVHAIDTDGNGLYRIDNVTEGEHEVRVSAFACGESRIIVRAFPGETVRADFRLQPVWLEAKHVHRPAEPTEPCSLHDIPMIWVLAPVSYGFLVVDPNEEFPNAWPHSRNDGGSESPESGALKADWTQTCLKCIHGWNLRRSKDKWQGIIETPSTSWTNYRISDVVEFRAPPALKAEVRIDSCSSSGRWEGPGLSVRIIRTPAWNGRGKGDYSVRAILDDCATDIAVTEQPQFVVAHATLVATTSSIDNVVITIKATGESAKQTVQRVFGSVAFR